MTVVGQDGPTPVAIIGCGRMGSAFARVWRQRRTVHAYDPSTTLPDGVARLETLAELPRGATVLLAVKPQKMAEVATALARHLAEDSLVISIAAGVEMATLRRLLGSGHRLVRAMPNTPVAIGLGVTAAYADASIAEADRAHVAGLFEDAGTFLWLEQEQQIDLVLGISGSGPAYFFRFAEALAAAGEAIGLGPAEAAELARATLAGAGGLAGPGASLAALRDEVTSPGGTTAAALRHFDDGKVDALVLGAVRAAMRRAAELADQTRG
jgi:pyrroline-5-carboxylate reductase